MILSFLLALTLSTSALADTSYYPAETLKGSWEGIYIDYANPQLPYLFKIDSLDVGIKPRGGSSDTTTTWRFWGYIYPNNDTAMWVYSLFSGYYSHNGFRAFIKYYNTDMDLMTFNTGRLEKKSFKKEDGSSEDFFVITGEVLPSEPSVNNKSRIFKGATGGIYILKKRKG